MKNSSLRNIKYINLTVLRNDGIVLHNTSSNDQEGQQFGALSAGLWQAACALQKQSNENFSLQYCSSSTGLAIYPISYQGDSLLLLAQYKDEKNPAKLKYEIKNLSLRIEEVLSVSNHGKVNRGEDDSKFLFTEISDKEMDNLFNQLE